MPSAGDINRGEITRRKLLYGTTTAFLAAGVAAALWPAIVQMKPNASSRPDEIDVDLSLIQAGNAISIKWRGKPILIRHRMPDEIQRARMTPMASLRDQNARLTGLDKFLPATDANRTKPGKEMWLVTLGMCTYENCLLKAMMPGDEKGAYQGLICPCCASAYDTAGRVRYGPAPSNLPIPPYRFTSDTAITIG